MVFGIALAIAAQAGRVSFAGDAARMEVVCRELASRTGLSIFTAGDLNDEVVEIDVRDVSVDDLLARLDDVLLAKAERTKDGWRLVADEKRREELRRAELAKRAARIRAVQERIRRDLAKEPPFDAQRLFAIAEAFGKRYDRADVKFESDFFETIRPLQRGAPGNRALRELVTHLPAGGLAMNRG